MAKVEVIGPKAKLAPVMEALQDVGLLHLTDVAQGHDVQARVSRFELEPEAAARRKRFEASDQGLREAVPLIAAPTWNRTAEIDRLYREYEAAALDRVAEDAESLVNELKRLSARKENLENDLALLDRYKAVIDALESVGARRDQAWVAALFEGDDKELFDRLAADAEKAAGAPVRFEKQKLPKGGQVIAVFAVKAEAQGRVRTYLWDQKVTEVAFPKDMQGLSVAEAADAVRRRQTQQKGELPQVEAAIEAYFADKGPRLVALAQYVRDRCRHYEALGKAVATKYAFCVQGWLPAGDLGMVRRRIEEKVGKGIVVNPIEAASDHEEPPVPVRLENPPLVRKFEPLLAVFPPPKYGTIDPTKVIAITFPLFFGYMVGDVGYGLLIGLFAAFLGRKLGGKMPIVKDVAFVFGVAAASACVFGVLFGEFFGSALSRVHVLPQHWAVWQGRHSPGDLNRYLGYSLLIGLLHMTLSCVFGMWNAYVEFHHGHKTALLHLIEKAGLLASLYGFALVALGMVEDLKAACPIPPAAALPLGGMLVGTGFLLLLIALPGMVKAIFWVEGMGIASNVLSYARLMAVGTAGVVLAEMANDFGQQTAAAYGVVPGVLLAVFIHLFNLALSVFDPTIQGLRLHYMEFFNRFYETGGVEYLPLQKKGGMA